jgi:hypothetical protein
MPFFEYSLDDDAVEAMKCRILEVDSEDNNRRHRVGAISLTANQSAYSESRKSRIRMRMEPLNTR